MAPCIDDKITRHKNFLLKQNYDKPLCGCYLGGWEDLSRYAKSTNEIMDIGKVEPEQIDFTFWGKTYESFMESTAYENDDFFRPVEPINSIPWSEAACGANVYFTGKNFWTEKITSKELIKKLERPLENNRWTERYRQFLGHLIERFPHYPIAPSLLRGPLDMLSAALGEENLIYSFYDDPQLVHYALEQCAQIFLEFYRIVYETLPNYHNGYIMSMYQLWTPGTCCRIQEDAAALLSPELYRQFIYPIDVKISSMTEYSLYHNHATNLHLVDDIILNKNLNIYQLNKDIVGGTDIYDMIDPLQKAQKKGLCLLVRGFFTFDDLRMLQNSLDKRGLAIAVQVKDKEQADIYMDFLHSLNW